MAHINLLPWREELRQQKKKQFIGFIGATALVSGGIVLLVHLYIAGMIDYQESRNNKLKDEIKLVEAKIKEIENIEKQKEQLIARMRVIEELQGNRPEVVHLLEEIAKVVPDGLYIETLTQKSRNVKITGKAQSNARVSAFMRQLEASNWFEAPKLDVISKKGNDEGGIRAFTLSVVQVNYKEDTE